MAKASFFIAANDSMIIVQWYGQMKNFLHIEAIVNICVFVFLFHKLIWPPRVPNWLHHNYILIYLSSNAVTPFIINYKYKLSIWM